MARCVPWSVSHHGSVLNPFVIRRRRCRLLTRTPKRRYMLPRGARNKKQLPAPPHLLVSLTSAGARVQYVHLRSAVSSLFQSKLGANEEIPADITAGFPRGVDIGQTANGIAVLFWSLEFIGSNGEDNNAPARTRTPLYSLKGAREGSPSCLKQMIAHAASLTRAKRSHSGPLTCCSSCGGTLCTA